MEGGFWGKGTVEGTGTLWVLGRALAIRLIGVPPTGELELLLVSPSWSGPPQIEVKRELITAFMMEFLLSQF